MNEKNTVHDHNTLCIADTIDALSIEGKVAQLFIVNPESLMQSEATLYDCDSEMEKVLSSLNLGGMLYFGRNLLEPYQIRSFINKTQLIAKSNHGIPLFQCVDEEGGLVSRVANRKEFNVLNVGDPQSLGRSGDTKKIYESGRYVGEYLADLGFNVDFAPCADVLTNPNNTVIGNRAYGSAPNVVADSAMAFAQGLMFNNVIPSFKHFPGHGDTSDDTHYGYAYSNKSLDDLFVCDLIPYIDGIKMGIPMIMVGHVSYPSVLSGNEPASLSRFFITDILRDRLEYDGLIITDSLKMKAISDMYSPEEAAILTVEAGADIVLRPIAFWPAYNGLVDAVKSGRIKEKRIDESLKRILKVKRLYIDKCSKVNLVE